MSEYGLCVVSYIVGTFDTMLEERIGNISEGGLTETANHATLNLGAALMCLCSSPPLQPALPLAAVQD